MIRAALIALAYVGMIAALLAAMSIHYAVTLKLVAVVMTFAAIAGAVIFIDETIQQRRKWRDHLRRRAGIIKDWDE